jgi:hypothetical protein
MKTTPWFMPKDRPIRVGVYAVDWPEIAGNRDLWYAYWDGADWGWIQKTPNDALFVYHDQPYKRHSAHSLAWLGLVKESK